MVDDDPIVRESLKGLFESAGQKSEVHSSAEAFLAAYTRNRPGCLVLDVRLEGMSGLRLQQSLARQDGRIPVIIITGYGDVPLAVQAMKAGAVDFLEKPLNDQALLQSVKRALALDAARRREEAQAAALAVRLASLTRRERQVLNLIVAGRATKDIAARLHLSPKTIEAHRANIMRKLHAERLADLVRTAVTARVALGHTPKVPAGKAQG